MKTGPAWILIMRRELGAFFSSPVAYIVSALFLVFSGLLFFSTFFLLNRAELRNFFSLLPVLYAFFIPALTMRLFAEEIRTGSLETLLTLPVSPLDAVLGKFAAALVFAFGMLLPTLLWVLTAAILGRPDLGPILGGYIGSFFLAAAFTAIGVFASALTRNQIVSFFTAFAVCILLAMIDIFLVLVPAFLVTPLENLSATWHFSTIARGVLDSRDVIYFLSLTVLFLTATAGWLEHRRHS